jgi:hypothetical protein
MDQLVLFVAVGRARLTRAKMRRPAGSRFVAARAAC